MIPPCKTLESLGSDTYLWIYTWNHIENEFYAIPIQNNHVSIENGLTQNGRKIVSNPIRVKFNASEYNHLVIVTQEIKKFQQAMNMLLQHQLIDYYQIGVINNSQLIMTEVSLNDLLKNKQLGTSIKIYSKKNCRNLVSLFKYNYHAFGIAAMGTYRHAFQCFFDHNRSNNNNFQSRGLFMIDKNYRLEFISGNVDKFFPPYRIVAFDIETCLLDLSGAIPKGDTQYDRLAMTAFQEATVLKPSEPTQLTDIRNLLIVYYPGLRKNEYRSPIFRVEFYPTERECLIRTLEELAVSRHIFVSGYNIDNYDYPYLFKRMIAYKYIPYYILANIRGYCDLTLVPHMTPPWVMSLDTMAFRKRFFPVGLYVNPASDSLDACAESVLNRKKLDFDILKINTLYYELEKNPESPISTDFNNLLEYNRIDVELVTLINGHLNIVRITCALSQMADVDPYFCLGQSTTAIARRYVENMFQSLYISPVDYNLLKERKKNNIGLYNSRSKYGRYTKHQICHLDMGKKNTFKGAVVLDPVIGVHKATKNSVIQIFDYTSLYPSLILDYNISRGSITRFPLSKWMGLQENQRILLSNKFHTLKLEGDSYFIYLSIKNPTSTLSQLCKQLIIQRQKLKTNKNNTTLANALKVLVNSLYGLMATPGPFKDEIAPSMVTGYGRKYLYYVRDYFKQNFKAQILYGDTDSIFVCVPRGDGNELARQYNVHLKEINGINFFLKLAYESSAGCVVFVSKKRYIIISEKSNDLKISGFKRRMSPRNHEEITKIIKEFMILVRDGQDDFLNQIKSLITLWFSNLLENQKDNSVCNVKIKPLYTYKSSSSIQFCLGSKIEKERPGTLTAEDGTYIPFYNLIPLVPITSTFSKGALMCPSLLFNQQIHTINRSVGLINDFGPLLNSLIKIVDPNFGATYNLNKLIGDYVQRERLLLYEKYTQIGYRFCNLSLCKYPSSPFKMDISVIWPINNQHYFMDLRWVAKKQKNYFFLCCTLQYESKIINVTWDRDSKKKKILQFTTTSIRITWDYTSYNNTNGYSSSIFFK